MGVLVHGQGQGPAHAQLKGLVVCRLEEGVLEDRVPRELLAPED
jgi:hypothetical protein